MVAGFILLKGLTNWEKVDIEFFLDDLSVESTILSSVWLCDSNDLRLLE
jgi:hypothetical protein